jgi:hypothetical protein
VRQAVRVVYGRSNVKTAAHLFASAPRRRFRARDRSRPFIY